MATEKDLVDEFLRAGVAAEQGQIAEEHRRKQRNRAGVIVAFVLVASFAGVASLLAIRSQRQASDLEIAATTDALQSSKLEAAATMDAARLAELGTAQAETQIERDAAQTAEAQAEIEKYFAQAAEATAEAESAIARSREIAAIAASQLEIDAGRSLLLAIESVAQTHTLQAENVLRQTIIESRNRVILPGHTGYYQDINWNRNGDRLAFISGINTVQIWDPIQLSTISTLESIYGQISSIAWSPDGTRLAAASRGGTIWLWDITTGEVVNELANQQEAINALAWSPNGQQLLIGGCSSKTEKIKCEKGGIAIWDITQNTEPRVINDIICEDTIFGCEVEDVAWRPRSDYFAAGITDGTVRLWHSITTTQFSVLSNDSSHIYTVTWSPDGKQLASLGLDGLLRVWDVANEDIVKTMVAHDNSVSSKAVRVAWSPNGKWLAFNGQDYKIRLWQLDTGRVIVLTGHTDDIKGLSWSPDSQKIASASHDGSVRIWDARGFGDSPIVLAKGLGYKADNMMWNSQGTDLAFSYYGLELWHLETKVWKTIAEFRSPRAVTWDPGGTKLALADSNHMIHIWDKVTSEKLVTFQGHSDIVHDISWSPDGRLLASAAGDHSIKIWNVSSGQVVQTIRPSSIQSSGNSSPGNVAWSPNGRWLAFALQEPIYWIWDIENDQKISVNMPSDSLIADMAWSPDGNKIATASDDVQIWQVETGDLLFSLSAPLQGPFSGSFSTAWSPNGRRLAVGYDDGTIRIWDVETQRNIKTFSEHTDKVISLAWSPDGKRLASGSQDFSARIYLTKIEDLLDMGKKQIPLVISTSGIIKKRQLTPEERYLYLGEPLATEVR